MTSGTSRVYRFGRYRLDASEGVLYKDGQLISLAPKVFETLLLLVTSGGRVLPRSELIKQLWPDTFVEEGTLTQYISLLRKALGDDKEWIENLPRKGYRFTAPVEIDPESGEVRPEEQIGTPAVPETPHAHRNGRFRVAGITLALLGVLAAAFVWAGRKEFPSARRVGSVAVLPFRTVPDAGSDYLADGLTEALVARLTNLEGLRVVSYSRMRRFRGTSLEATEIGKQLGVEAVIEGTVRVDSGRLRLNVHAVDAKSGYTIWSVDRFEANPTNVLDLEGQVAESVALRFKGKLTAAERGLVTKPASRNPEAYDLVLKVRRLLNHSAPVDLPAVIRMLEEAVKLDPEFGEAYGWLALAQGWAYSSGQAGSEILRAAISNANQSLSRDPDALIAMRALTHIQHSTGREIEGLVMARRALDRNPEDLDATAAAAEAYFRTGLYDRAIPLYRKALEWEPGNREFSIQLARIYLFLGEYDAGLKSIAALPPSQAGVFGMLLFAAAGKMDLAKEAGFASVRKDLSGFSAYMLGCLLTGSGDLAGAKKIWSEGVRHAEAKLARHENPYTRWSLGMLYARLGQREKAIHNIEQSLAADPRHPVFLFFAAQTRAVLGDRRLALETLKAAVDNGFFNLPMIEYHTRPVLAFSGLRDDAGFRRLRADLARRLDVLRTQ